MSVEGGINKCFVYLPSKVTSYMDNILLAPLRLRIAPPPCLSEHFMPLSGSPAHLPPPLNLEHLKKHYEYVGFLI